MELLFKISSAIRSLRAAYLRGPLEKHAPVVYLVCRRPADAAIVSSQSETIGALAKSSKSPPPGALHLVPAGCAPPGGCATEVLDKDTEVHVFLKGVVDFSQEVARLQKDLTVKRSALEKLQTKRADPNYESRVPVATQQEDKDKEENLVGQVKALDAQIAQFSAA